MDQNLLMKQRELNDRLNRYRNEYYNLNSPSVSDASMTDCLRSCRTWKVQRASRCQIRPPIP